MQKALSSLDEPPVQKPQAVRDQKVIQINVYAIRAAAFTKNLKDKDCEFFTTSIYEIDRLIEERTQEEDAP
jgi:hypothetical protein